MTLLSASVVKRSSILSILCSTFILGSSNYATAVDYNGFILSGDVRTGWVSYDYGNPDGEPLINKGHKDSEGFYVIPKLSLQTPSHKGFNAKITVAGATDFGINDEDKQSRNFVFDPTENESFVILQEIYLEYDNEMHNAMVGRNEIITPMIESDDWYMLANSFEIAKYTNNSFQNTHLHVGFFRKMAGVWDSGANGTEFHSMSDASFVNAADKEAADDEGVYYLAAEYNGEKHHGQLWEYYAEDLYNMLFGQYNYKSGNSKYNYDFGLQFIDWQEVGKLKDGNTTNIDYSLYSIKYDGNMDNGFSFATGYSKYTDGEGTGATLGAWGGYPYFANGMIFHFFEAGDLRNAASYKVQGAYDLTKVGFNNAALSIRYTYYDLDSKYSFTESGQAQEAMKMLGVRLNYSFLNGGYFTGTVEQHDTDHEHSVTSIRLIGGYKF
jgi:hypothetical protein